LKQHQDLASKRNTRRIDEANKRDADTIGTYLLPLSSDIFIDVVSGPDDFFFPPPWLLGAVAEVAALEVKSPLNPGVCFDTSPPSLDHNSSLLCQHGYDLESFLGGQAGTTLEYGAEFRPVHQLEKVLGNHPNFTFFREVLLKGMKYSFTQDLSEDERLDELEKQLARGNHKSVSEKPEVGLLLKDVAHGFSLPIKVDTVRLIRGAMVEPCGITSQFKLQPDGTRELADRLTQDLSYSISSLDASVNSRIKMSDYTEMIYGWCLGRVVHFILALRKEHPGKKIFISKYDYSDAYRRIHHAASAAAQSISVRDGVGYIALRLTFGGSPNPPTWCAFSEMVTDLSNELMLCREWDPLALHGPDQSTTPTPRELPANIPIAEARDLAVSVPVSATARTDSFIDDLILVFLDTPGNRERCPHAVPLAIHVTSRPHSGKDEPITRRPLLSPEKLEAEGIPVEVQNVLGWSIDTRRLLLMLPLDKYLAWSGDIDAVIKSSRISSSDLESLVGRLNHVSFLIPLSRHFLSRFRDRVHRSSNRPQGKQKHTLSPDEMKDLVLWKEFLHRANGGISMNRISHRQPSQLGWSDSCPSGLGGFSLNGTAWRLRIPDSSPIFGVATVNNVLEFLALTITLWTIILECEWEGASEECILVLGDSTSAIGWLFRTGHVQKESFYYAAVHMIARKIARLIAHSSHCLASQHLKGSLNVVADLLSYEGTSRGEPHPLAEDKPDDTMLTRRFHLSLPQLIPRNFAISQLPDAVLSFAILVLRTTELSFIQSRKEPTRTETESGVVGPPSAPAWASTITRSSVCYPHKTPNYCPELSSPFYVPVTGTSQEELLETVRSQWLRTLSAMPQAIWLRRFGTISNGAPFTSREATSSSPPSNHSSEPMTRPIQPPIVSAR
jgi:hypothetical protein